MSNAIPVFGDNIMRISILFIMLLASLFITGSSFAAGGPLQLKYVHSVYADAKETGLKHPEGVGCTDEYFIVADTGNNRLVKYTFQKNVANAVDLEMLISSPLAVQINSKGEIYALDGKDKRIVIFNPDGTEKGKLAPKGSPFAGQPVPRSFKIGQDDKIYILDISDGVVLILDPEGNYLRHVSFPEKAGFFSDLAVDGKGTVFLVDSTKVAVYAAAPDADKFSPRSEGMKEFANFPTNIAIDNNNFIFLVDKHGGDLVILNPSGSFLGHKFGFGWKESMFYYPSQMCISKEGNAFIADSGNSRIQIFISE